MARFHGAEQDGRCRITAESPDGDMRSFGDPRLLPPGTATVDSAFAAAGLATWCPLTPLRHAAR